MMINSTTTSTGRSRAPEGGRAGADAFEPGSIEPDFAEILGDSLSDLEPSPELAAQAERRTVQGKLAAGWRGLKAAMRGDSSFFAHTYRGTLIVIAAAIIGVDFRGWCLLILGACL